MSGRSLACLLASNDKSATKHVIWSRKSTKTATAAYRENTRTAGIVDIAPVMWLHKERIRVQGRNRGSESQEKVHNQKVIEKKINPKQTNKLIFFVHYGKTTHLKKRQQFQTRK